MHRSIVSYCKNYLQNFREHPGKTTVALALQIVFLAGWITFFTFMARQYVRYIIPGITEPKGAIYSETFSQTVISVLFLFFIYKAGKVIFANDSKLMPKFAVLTLSLLCAAVAFPLQIWLEHLVFFLPDTNIAFWAD